MSLGVNLLSREGSSQTGEWMTFGLGCYKDRFPWSTFLFIVDQDLSLAAWPTGPRFTAATGWTWPLSITLGPVLTCVAAVKRFFPQTAILIPWTFIRLLDEERTSGCYYKDECRTRLVPAYFFVSLWSWHLSCPQFIFVHGLTHCWGAKRQPWNGYQQVETMK